MGDWGWGTGLAVWGTGCLVRIAGFHSWAVAAEKEAGKVVSVSELSHSLECQDCPTFGVLLQPLVCAIRWGLILKPPLSLLVLGM